MGSQASARIAESWRITCCVIAGVVLTLIGWLTNLGLAKSAAADLTWHGDAQGILQFTLPLLDSVVIVAFLAASLHLGWRATRTFWMAAGTLAAGSWLAIDLVPALATARSVPTDITFVRILLWLLAGLLWISGFAIGVRGFAELLTPIHWLFRRRTAPMVLAAAAIAIRIGLTTYELPFVRREVRIPNYELIREVPSQYLTLTNPFESPQFCIELNRVGPDWDAVQRIVQQAVINRTPDRAAELMQHVPRLICESADRSAADRIVEALRAAGAEATVNDTLDQFMSWVIADQATPFGRPSQLLWDATNGAAGEGIFDLRTVVTSVVEQAGASDRETIRRAYVAFVTAQGRMLFQVHCSACHGVKGSGDGAAANGFALRPANFRDRNSLERLVPGEILWRIEEGAAGLVPGWVRSQSVMPAWKHELDRELVWKTMLGLFSVANRQPGPVGRPGGNSLRTPTVADAPEVPDESWLGWPVPQPPDAVELESADSARRGEYVYYYRCMPCHGIDGQGDGPVASSLWPRPRDFTTHNFAIETNQPKFKFRTTRQGWLPSDADLFRSISRGLTGTAMEGWAGVLSDREIWQVIAHIKSFARAWNDPEHSAFNPNDPVVVRQFVESDGVQPIIDFDRLNPPSIGTTLVQSGRDAYLRFGCAECHGVRLRGDGPAMGQHYDDWGYRMWPQDLASPWSFKAGRSLRDVYRSIAHRLDGSVMPVYGPDTFDRSDLRHGKRLQWAVAAFVRESSHEGRRRSRSAVRALTLETAIPTDPFDPIWDRVPITAIPLSGQAVVSPRWAAHSVREIAVRAAVNGTAMSLWLQWDDRRPNVSHRDAIADSPQSADPSLGPVTYAAPAGRPRDPVIFQSRDQLEIQFPDWIETFDRDDGQASVPPLLYGSSELPVLLCRWYADRQGMSLSKQVVEYSGVKTERLICTPDSGEPHDDAIEWLRARGIDEPFQPVSPEWPCQSRADWSDGIWTVVISGMPRFDATDSNDVLPIAFHVWDGLAGESGLRMAMSSWVEVVCPVARPYWQHLLAAGVALSVVAGIGWLSSRARVPNFKNDSGMALP